VHIPPEALVTRVAELPPKGSIVRVVDGARALEACRILLDIGRVASIETPPAGERGAYRLWGSVLDHLQLNPPTTALDLGCGTGRDAVLLASMGWEVLAIDRLPEALDSVQRLAERYSVSVMTQRLDYTRKTPPCEPANLTLCLRAYRPALDALLTRAPFLILEQIEGKPWPDLPHETVAEFPRQGSRVKVLRLPTQ
jgi:SAM-dependent methyltransferase